MVEHVPKSSWLTIALKRYLHRVFMLVPKLTLLYVLSKRYVDDYHGDNNWDFTINGELRFMKRNFPNFRVVFDVGAHEGEWTKVALSINQNLDIHCFEPSKFTFKRLLKNRFPDNVITNNFGLGSRRERRALHIFARGFGTNSLYQRFGLQAWGIHPATRREQVRIETLDHYCQKRSITQIDFVKIDVEGHELKVLKGMTGKLGSGEVGVIGFEYGGTYVAARIFLKDIFDFFERFDYQLYKVFPNRLEHVSRYDIRYDNLQYQNWLAIKKGYRFLP